MISDIWSFQQQLTRRLMVWSIGSIFIGILMLIPSNALWRGIGVQFIAWGAIDAAIAWLGDRSARRRQAKSSDEELLITQPAERSKLARILWINTGLDVLYVISGVYLTRDLGASDPFWFGGGIGIIIQGGFLFFFDWLHARKLK